MSERLWNRFRSVSDFSRPNRIDLRDMGLRRAGRRWTYMGRPWIAARCGPPPPLQENHLLRPCNQLVDAQYQREFNAFLMVSGPLDRAARESLSRIRVWRQP